MMDSLIGGGSQRPQTPQQQAVYINPDNLTDILCECGWAYFKPVVKLHKLPALLSPTGQEHIIPEETLLCTKCGKEFPKNQE